MLGNVLFSTRVFHLEILPARMVLLEGIKLRAELIAYLGADAAAKVR